MVQQISWLIIAGFVGAMIGFMINRKNSHKTPCECLTLYKVEREAKLLAVQDHLGLQKSKLETIECRLDRGDKRFEVIEKANITLENKIDRINDKLDDISKNVKTFTNLQELIIKKLMP